MSKKIFVLCLFLSSATTRPLAAQDTPSEQSAATDAAATGLELLEDLDRKTEDIINRSNTTPEDMARETHMPTWKKWVMQAGDFMYWSLKTGVDTVQALCSRCKNAVVGNHESEKPAA